LRQNLAEAYGMNGMFVDAERMARKDLKPEEIKRNLAYYRTHHAAASPAATFYADMVPTPLSDGGGTQQSRRVVLATTKTFMSHQRRKCRRSAARRLLPCARTGFANSGQNRRLLRKSEESRCRLQAQRVNRVR